MFCMRFYELAILMLRERWIWSLKGYVALDEELGKPEIAPGGMPPDACDVVKRLNQIMMRVRYHGG